MAVITESRNQEKEDSDNEENEIVSVSYNDKIVYNLSVFVQKHPRLLKQILKARTVTFETPTPRVDTSIAQSLDSNRVRELYVF